jgi:hypothetical protein
MVVTLVVVTGATVLTVGYMNYRSARATLDTIETQIRQSIARKDRAGHQPWRSRAPGWSPTTRSATWPA